MATIIEQPTETREALLVQSPTLRLFSVAEYYKMAETGILRAGERVELIEGRILTMSPKGIEHAATNDQASEVFRKSLGARVIVRNQNPIHLADDTEPEPDLVLAAPHEKRYFDHHPTPAEILLVLEIADSSLTFDRRNKGLLYAKAGIIQYLILNSRAREVEEYRDPSPDGYRSKHTYNADQSFSLAAFAGVTIEVSELLPPG